MAAKSAASEAPQKLPDFRTARGHDAVLARWRTLSTADRLPGVLLVTGRAGIGKSLLLAAAAAMSVCATADACGLCDSCRMVLSGAHPEILWLGHAEGSLGVDDAALVQEHLALRPASGNRCRVAIIDHCDRLTIPAANRLLKIFEEPPASARIILSTARPGALLATIKSRCVRWRIAPPPLTDAIAIVQSVCYERGLEEPPDDAIRALLKLAGGAPGLALARIEAGAEPPSLTWPRSIGAALDWAQGVRGVPLTDTLAALEIKLNSVYQQAEQQPQWPLVAKRRALIAAVRKASAHGKVAVSAQLLAEAVGLMGTF